MQKLPSQRLIVASHNTGKLKEFSELMKPLGIETASVGQLSLPEPEETGKTFEENAAIKAIAAAGASGDASVSDDSGLCIDALDGAPGIYSARWAGPGKDFGTAMTKVEKALKDRGTDDYAARFVCVLCLAMPAGEIQYFRGECTGHLVFPPRGAGGFGYDPIFQPDGYQQTFAEMGPSEKKNISHRARAFAQFSDWLTAGS